MKENTKIKSAQQRIIDMCYDETVSNEDIQAALAQLEGVVDIRGIIPFISVAIEIAGNDVLELQSLRQLLQDRLILLAQLRDSR